MAGDRHSPATAEWLQPAYERSLVERHWSWQCTPASRPREEVGAVGRHGGDHKSREEGQRNIATLIRGNAPISAHAGLSVNARSAPLIASSPGHRANPRPPERRASATPPTRVPANTKPATFDRDHGSGLAAGTCFIRRTSRTVASPRPAPAPPDTRAGYRSAADDGRCAVPFPHPRGLPPARR